jgi:hypothetical protein
MTPGISDSRGMRRWIAAAAFCALPVLVLSATGKNGDPAGDYQPLPATLAESMDRIRHSVEKIRGLKFLKPITSHTLTEDEARAHLGRIIDRQYNKKELESEDFELRYLGLLSGPRTLEEVLLDSLQGQIAGLYDPFLRSLFVVSGATATRATLAHELVHGLDDQHFELGALMERARAGDAGALSLSALMEGDATLVTMNWLKEEDLPYAPSAEQIMNGDAAWLVGGLRNSKPGMPATIKEYLLFPYEAGTRWAAFISNENSGMAGLDAYFQSPPESTEQILHPRKSLPPRDLPSLIGEVEPFGDLAGDESNESLYSGELGEFGIALLFSSVEIKDAASAAAGWDGDRYWISSGSGGSRFRWLSVWDSEKDARQFLVAGRKWAGHRARGGGEPAKGSEPVGFSAVRQGKLVLIQEGIGRLDGPGSTALARAFLSRASARIVFR